MDVNSFRSRDEEEEVAGYADLMELVFESYANIPLTENTIRQFHGILLRYSHKDERHRGNYKTLSNSVEAFDTEGRSVGVIFETATPFDTPRLMEVLVAWSNEVIEEQEHHPLLIIAVFVVRFLAIHPFQDGNGRLSRALTTGRVTVREAAAITQANRSTIKEHLKQLVNGGRLARHGQGRGTWYEKA